MERIADTRGVIRHFIKVGATPGLLALNINLASIMHARDGRVIECRDDVKSNVLLTVKPTKRIGTCESSDYL